MDTYAKHGVFTFKEAGAVADFVVARPGCDLCCDNVTGDETEEFQRFIGEVLETLRERMNPFRLNQHQEVHVVRHVLRNGGTIQDHALGPAQRRTADRLVERGVLRKDALLYRTSKPFVDRELSISVWFPGGHVSTFMDYPRPL